MKKIKILNWNAAGAKFLRDKEKDRREFKKELNRHLQRLLEDQKPDFIVLQEVAQYDNDSKREDLIERPKGYFYKASIAIDSERQSHPMRWQAVREKGEWPPTSYLAQGYGILWRQDISHCSIWDFDNPKTGPEIQMEEVHLDTGLYTGDRDTEPRLAVVAHFVFHDDQTPIDVFVVNLHLITLKGEREGKLEKDDLGARIRMAQIDTVLHGVVSRYNDWRSRTPAASPRVPPVWVIAGDFNCTPDSHEILKLQRMNFLDLNPNKGKGGKTSGRGSEPTITVDYIFAGPKYVAFDPYIVEHEIKGNPAPLDHIAISDHFPLIAKLPISIPARVKG